MSPEQRFCISCGQPISPDARFCASCGAPLAASPEPGQTAPATPAYVPSPTYQPPPPPAPGVPGEALIGIMPCASRKKNFVSVESFNIIVTSQRIVFAAMTSQMIKDEAAKNRGGGVAGFFAAMTVGYDLWKRYLEIPPEQALGENPGNFAIYFNQIHKVKFDGGRVLYKKGAVSVGLSVNRNEDEPAKLEIESVSGRYKFDIPTNFEGQARDVLKKAGLIK